MFSYLLSIALVAAVSADPIRPKSSFPDGRIIGGTDAEITTYPYQVSVQYMGQHDCGGSIISDRYIVTAGHCVRSDKSVTSIRVGTTFSGEGGRVYEVEEVVRHEDYHVNQAGVPINDIAVMKVSEAFVFDDEVQPIGLYESGEETFPGVTAVITGWGSQQSGGPAADHLQVVTIPIITKDLCNEAYEDMGGVPQGQICAAYYGVGGKDACQGDSGGPLAVDGRLAGVVSWGSGCAMPFAPGAYSEVAHYREWIESHTKLN